MAGLDGDGGGRWLEALGHDAHRVLAGGHVGDLMKRESTVRRAPGRGGGEVRQTSEESEGGWVGSGEWFVGWAENLRKCMAKDPTSFVKWVEAQIRNMPAVKLTI